MIGDGQTMMRYKDNSFNLIFPDFGPDFDVLRRRISPIFSYLR